MTEWWFLQLFFLQLIWKFLQHFISTEWGILSFFLAIDWHNSQVFLHSCWTKFCGAFFMADRRISWFFSPWTVDEFLNFTEETCEFFSCYQSSNLAIFFPVTNKRVSRFFFFFFFPITDWQISHFFFSWPINKFHISPSPSANWWISLFFFLRRLTKFTIIYFFFYGRLTYFMRKLIERAPKKKEQ